MERVLVLGSGGAGKTTVSRAIARRTGLPLIHLDALYWQPGWQPTAPERWERLVSEVIAGPRWILDGNYGGTLAMRLAACDTVVFLDTPRLLCLTRLLRRRIRYRSRVREELPENCAERLTPDFVRWVWTYPARRRPGVLAQLADLDGSKEVHVLRGGRAVNRFLASL